MIEKEFLIKNEIGLHARPAAKFVQISNQFDAEVNVEKGNKIVNGKSIMGVMALGASKGEKIRIIITGDDEEEAMNEITYFIEEVLPKED